VEDHEIAVQPIDLGAVAKPMLPLRPISLQCIQLTEGCDDRFSLSVCPIGSQLAIDLRDADRSVTGPKITL
jgi:hypothetical protein